MGRQAAPACRTLRASVSTQLAGWAAVQGVCCAGASPPSTPLPRRRCSFSSPPTAPDVARQLSYEGAEFSLRPTPLSCGFRCGRMAGACLPACLSVAVPARQRRWRRARHAGGGHAPPLLLTAELPLRSLAACREAYNDAAAFMSLLTNLMYLLQPGFTKNFWARGAAAGLPACGGGGAPAGPLAGAGPIAWEPPGLLLSCNHFSCRPPTSCSSSPWS